MKRLSVGTCWPSSAAAAVVFVVSQASCTVIYPVDEVQCTTDADCTSRGAAFADAVCVNELCEVAEDTSPFACIGNVTWPSVGPPRVRISIQVIDVILEGPPTELNVRVCAKLDTPCADPLGTGSMDATGMVTAEVDSGFVGYLELTSPTITPALFFVTKPVVEDTTVASILPVVSPEGFGGIAQAIGTTLDLDTSGHIYVLAADCGEQPAAGVRLELDAAGGGVPYYMINNLPVGTANATDPAGNGGFLNVAPAFVSVSGFVDSTGARIGEASLLTRVGAVSYPRLVPTP